jgi:DNA polymerase
VERVQREPGAVRAQLDDLRTRYETQAPHAQFGTTFTNIVFGEGDPCARLLFVGEAPGEDEDLSGRPFVGRAGQLLEKMIVAMGLTRERVYICNVLKTRPPGNRPPTPEETIASAPYLYEQIAIVYPEVIVTLGRPATHLLLRTQDAIGRLRGVWGEFEVPPPAGGAAYSWDFPGMRFAVMPTYHPSYLLRSYTEENRKAVWSDLKQVLDRLGLKPPASGGVRAG